MTYTQGYLRLQIVQKLRALETPGWKGTVVEGAIESMAGEAE